MLGLQTLDVILGLVFIYLLLSLVCTAVNEVVAQWLNWRAKTLRQGLRTLLADAPWDAPGSPDTNPTVEKLYTHPLIAGLSQVRRNLWGGLADRMPSYIPSRTFARALLDVVNPGAVDAPADSPPMTSDLRAAVNQLPEAIRRPLLIFMTEAAGDVNQLMTEMERWYTDAMERVSGLYKRRTKVAILIIAAVVTLITNADSLRIGRALSSDAALRSALVAHAERLAANPSEELGTRRAADSGTADTSAIRQIRGTIDTLQSLGIPLGWPEVKDRLGRPLSDSLNWGQRLGAKARFYASDAWPRTPGLLITALALSLGAPFWFDLLNRIVNIRAAGRAPEEKQKPPEALPPPRGA